MSANNQPLGSSNTPPLQRVGLNTSLTSVVLDSESGKSSLLVKTDSNNAIYVDKYANVGINTTSPTAQLEVASSNGSCFRLRYGTSETSFANIFMGSAGDLSINPNTAGKEINTTASLNIINHNGTTSGLKLGGVLVSATAAQLNSLTAAEGTVSASKAVVVDADKSVSGINALTANTLTGEIQTAAQPKVTSLGTLSSLNVTNGVIASSLTGTLQTADQPNITSVGTLGSLNVTYGVTASTLTGTLQTAAQPNVTSVGTLGSLSVTNGVIASSLTGTLQTAAQPNVTSVGTLSSLAVTGAVTSASLTSTGAVSGSTLTGEIQTASQPKITSLGTLSSLSVNGDSIITSTTDATGSTGSASLSIAGGLAVAKNAFVGSNLTVTGNLIVNGTTTTINSTSMTINDNILTLNASPVSAVDSGLLINRYQIPNDSALGSIIQDGANYTPTVNTATTLLITLNFGSSIDNYYQGWWFMFLNQVRQVKSYVASTKVITLNTALTTAPSTGSTIQLYNRTFASFIWNENNKQFVAGYTALDSTSTLQIINKADLGVGNLIASGYIVGTTLTGEVQTASQPKITSIGTLSSLAVTGAVTSASLTSTGAVSGATLTSTGAVSGATLTATGAVSGSTLTATGAVSGSTLTGEIQTPAQPKITSIGTLGSLSVTNGVSATTLTLGAVSLTSTNAGYISGITVGSGTALKALVLDSSKNITGINCLCLGTSTDTTNRLLSILNSSLTVGGSMTSLCYGQSNSANNQVEFTFNYVGAGSSSNSLDLKFNGGSSVLKLAADGNLDIPQHNGTSTGLKLGGTLVTATASEINYTDVVAGTATASKALVLDSSSNIAGINTLTTNELRVSNSITGSSTSLHITNSDNTQ